MDNNDNVIALFGDDEGKEFNIEVVNAKFLGSEMYHGEDLFLGFSKLKVITFSYGLGFIEKISDTFKEVDIIIGFKPQVKYDIYELMAFQEESLELIRRRRRLIERVEKKEVSFSIANQEMPCHEKFYIMSNENGDTRILTGSANFSTRAFNGDLRENIIRFENDERAYEWYLNEFNNMKECCCSGIIQKTLLNGAENIEKPISIKEIPIIKEAIAKEAGIILDATNPDEERMEYLTDIDKIRTDIVKMGPKISSKKGLIHLTPEIAHTLIKKEKAMFEEKKVVEKSAPQFVIDYDAETAVLNGNQFNLEVDPNEVSNSFSSLTKYFDGYDEFIGDQKAAKEKYFKIMNYMMLSPFIAKLRNVAVKKEFYSEMCPNYAVIYGPKSAGKSNFVETIQLLMFGEKFGRVGESHFTPTRMQALMASIKGIPIHLNDLDNTRFAKDSLPIIKSDEYLLDEAYSNHPAVIITTNSIRSFKPEIGKRTVWVGLDITLSNEVAHKLQKKIADIRNNIGTAFYREYLRRMIPKVNEVCDRMKEYVTPEEGEAWAPDIFEISSHTITEIIKDVGLDIPAYIKVLNYGDYFGYNDMKEMYRNKLLLEWKHNTSAFVRNSSSNQLVYDTGISKYEAQHIADAMPEELRATTSGPKVVMDLNKAEEYFGTKFKKTLWKRFFE